MTATTEKEIEATRDRLRKYNRDYYHAHKTPSDCQHCNTTFSSLSALKRHQGRNMKCQLIQTKRELEQSQAKR